MSAGITPSEAASRQQCLDDLDEFIQVCQQDITDMLDTLDWTPEHFMQPRQQSVCPFNSEHRMPVSSLQKHTPVCELIQQGLSKKEATSISEDTSFFYKDASCVYPVKVDLDLLNSMLWNHHVQNHSVFYGYKQLPRTPEEEQGLISREDRRALAEYIINRAKEANRLKELGQDEMLVSENLADLIKKNNEERKLDPVEEMAALRDYRRRRQTYRAKNVHITKKSHTEIMREVINNQMEMYLQSLKDESAEKRNKEEGEAQSRSRDNQRSETTPSIDQSSRSAQRSSSRSRYRSRSRSHSKDRDKQRHHKDRHRSHSRSRSLSRESKSKKSKHKKSKHKKSKKSKKSRSSDRESDEEMT